MGTPQENLANFRFIEIDVPKKKLFLNLLGYDVDDEGFVINKSDKKRVECIYTKEFVHIKSASILPGSTIIINTSPYTLSCYISDYLAGEGIENEF